MTNIRKTIVVAALATLAAAPEASAHAHLKSAVPPVGGTVAASPNELDLTFSEGLNLAFTGVALAGPDKAAIATGPAKLASGGDTTLVIPIPVPLRAGTYAVKWRALSTDGHKTDGHYTFTVAP